MKKRHILAFFSTLTTILWLWAVIAYHKLGAEWFGINIWIFAIVLALVFVGVAALFRLFSPDDSTPRLVLAFLAIFIVVSLVEGVFISEPSLTPQHSSGQATASSDGGGSSNFFYYYWHESTTSHSSSSSSSSSSKGEGYVILFLLLIALLLLSAIIPHFWVIAIFIGMILLWGFTIKEFKRASDFSYSSRLY